MYLSPTTGQITSKSISKVVLNIWYILQLRKIFCGILMAFQCKLKVTFYFNTRINCYTRSVDKINDKIHSFKIIGVCQFIDIHVYEYMRRQNTNTWQNEEWNTSLFIQISHHDYGWHKKVNNHDITTWGQNLWL